MKSFKKILMVLLVIFVFALTYPLDVNAESKRSYITEPVELPFGNVENVATWTKPYGESEIEETASGLIIRSKVESNAFSNTQVVYSRNGEKASFKAENFKMSFYANTGDYLLYFSAADGALNSGKFFGLRLWAGSHVGQGNSARLSAQLIGQADPNGTYVYDVLSEQWLGYDGGGNEVKYNNDYDYFKDSDATYYDQSSNFSGTLNTLELKYVGEEFHLFLNDYDLFNLSTIQVNDSNVFDAIVKPMMDNMYLGVDLSWATGAFKIASIETVKKTDILVKTLIPETATSETVKDGSVWEGNGNWGAYKQEVETIVDDTQLDGGDMIFHTTVDGTQLVSSEWGYGKHSEIQEKACYSINGLVINFYANTSEFFIYFGENYGTSNSGRFFGIGIDPSSSLGGRARVQTRLMAQTSGGYGYPVKEWAWLGYDQDGNEVLYNNDYDYFKDPVSAAYDQTSSFTGTMNTIEFKDDENGHLSLYLNNFKLYDLTNCGGMNVVGDVISVCEAGMYISFIAGQAAPSQFKLVDIYNKVSSEQTGVPQGYTTTNPSNISYVKTSAGLYEFTDLGNDVFDFYYADKKYSGDNTITLQFKATELNENDAIKYTLGNVVLEFVKLTNTTAKLNVYNEETKLLEIDSIDYYFTGADNVVSVKLTYALELSVNGTKVVGGLDSAYQSLANAEDGLVTVGFAVVSDASSKIIVTDYQNSNVEVLEKIPGSTVTNNATIKSYNGGYAAFNNENGAFKLVYDANKLICYSASIKYIQGAINEDATEFKINFKDSTNTLSFHFIKGDEKTTLNVYANNELVGTSQIVYDWTIGEKGFSFVDDGGYDYLVYDLEGRELIDINSYDNETEFGKIKALIESIPNQMVTVELEAVNGRQLISFRDYDYYIASSIKAQYAAGGYETGKTRFGVDKEGEAVIVFDGNSTLKSDPTFFDGFLLTFRGFYKNDGNTAIMALSPSSSWYSLIQSKKILLLELSPENGNEANFRVRYFDGQYKEIVNAHLTDINWNNNIPNTIKLNKVEGNWVFNVNGKDVTFEGEYNDMIESIYEDIQNNECYLEFDSGSNSLFRIDKVATVSYNNPPVAQKYTFEKEYTKGQTLTIDLTKLFYDADGDTLAYTATKGVINNNTFTLELSEVGDISFSITATDIEGEEATKEITIKVVENKEITPTEKDEPSENNDDKKGCKNGLTLSLVFIPSVIALGAFALRKKEN